MIAMLLAGVMATTIQAAPLVDLEEGDVKTEHVQGELRHYGARTLMVRMTAYTWTGNRTRTGTWPRWGTVAVDPSVIPLGSRLLIDGYPGTVFTAEDTGGGVRGYHVDIYFDTYAEAIRFGVQQRTVRVLLP